MIFFRISVTVWLTIILLGIVHKVKAIDTLIIDTKVYKQKLPFTIIKDQNYDWQDALSLILSNQGTKYEDNGRIFRSYNDYWTGGIIKNISDTRLNLLIEGNIAELWLNGVKIPTCAYEECIDTTGILQHPKSHVGYIDLNIGEHSIIMRLSEYHLKRNMSPTISSRHIYESLIYSSESWHIFAYIILVALFFLLSILSTAIYTKIKEKSFLYYSIFCLLIGIHAFRNLGSNFEIYNVIDKYAPWYYLKYFWFGALYFCYFRFGTFYINAEKNYPIIHKITEKGIKVLFVLLVPEIILILLKLDRISYSYYFCVRYMFTLFGLYLLYRLWFFKGDKFVKLILLGGNILLITELITSTFDSEISRLVGAVGLIGEIIVFTIAFSYKVYYEYYHSIILEKENIAKELTIQKLQEDKLILSMKTQQAQLNPHFMYNALNSIKEFILENKPSIASTYLSKFANLMRKVLDFSYKESIYLSEEIEITKQFLEFHLLMNKNKIDYEITIEDSLEIELIQVPPLFMQPYLENIFVHAFPNQDGLIKINIYENDTDIIIDIIDNGIGRNASQHSTYLHESKGMKINHERIESWGRILGKESTVKIFDLIDNSKSTGTRVSIHV